MLWIGTVEPTNMTESDLWLGGMIPQVKPGSGKTLYRKVSGVVEPWPDTVPGAASWSELDSKYSDRPAGSSVIFTGPYDPRLIPGTGFVSGSDKWAVTSPPAVTNQYFTNFAADTIGGTPAGWSKQWDSGTFTLSVIDAGSGTKAMRVSKGSSLNIGMVSWDAIPLVTDVEVVVKWRGNLNLNVATPNQQYHPLHVRAGVTPDTGVAKPYSGYYAFLANATPSAKLNIGAYDDGQTRIALVSSSPSGTVRQRSQSRGRRTPGTGHASRPAVSSSSHATGLTVQASRQRGTWQATTPASVALA